MGASYEVRLYSPAGQFLTVFRNFSKLDYARKENNYAPLTLELADTGLYPWGYFKLDSRLTVWRTINGETSARLEGDTVYFLRGWEYFSDSNSGRRMIRLKAYDANYLLDGFEVEYNSGSAQALKTDEIDDIMKAILRENRGSLATDTSRLNAFLTIQADLGLGPSTTKGFSRRQGLGVLQDLAQEAYERGTYLAFDLVPTSETMLEFRTYTGQRGINRGLSSTRILIVGEQYGNLFDVSLSEDHTNEFNVIYGAGQGTGDDRVIKEVFNAGARDISPFSRREKTWDCRNNSDEDAVEADARGELYACRPLTILSGTVRETPSFLYGKNFAYGDLLVAQHLGFNVECHLSFIHVTVKNGEELLDLKIKGEVLLMDADFFRTFQEMERRLWRTSNVESAKDSVAVEVFMPITRLTKGATAPTDSTRAVGGSGNIKVPVLAFAGNRQDEVFFEFHVPDDCDGVTGIEFHVMWWPASGWTSGNYLWKLEYLVKGEYTPEVLDTGTPTTITHTAVTPASAVTIEETHMTGTIAATAEQTVMCHLWRDAATDTSAAAAELRFVEFEYTAKR